MTTFEQLWDHSYTKRTTSEWRTLFETVAESFSAFIQHSTILGDVLIDDEQDAAQSSIGASLEIPVVDSIGLRFCGSLDISVKRGQSVSVRALLLLFCNNHRLAIHPKHLSPLRDWYWLDLHKTDPLMEIWHIRECIDESGEWEQFLTYNDWASPQ